MKKIVSIISIFAIILSATQFVLADYSDDTTITDGQFATFTKSLIIYNFYR